MSALTSKENNARAAGGYYKEGGRRWDGEGGRGKCGGVENKKGFRERRFEVRKSSKAVSERCSGTLLVRDTKMKPLNFEIAQIPRKLDRLLLDECF